MGSGKGEELGEQSVPLSALGRQREPVRPRNAEPRAAPPAPGPEAQWQAGPHLQGGEVVAATRQARGPRAARGRADAGAGTVPPL